MRSVVAFKDGSAVETEWPAELTAAQALWTAVRGAEAGRGGEPHDGAWLYTGKEA
jgi:hypothetical protein